MIPGQVIVKAGLCYRNNVEKLRSRVLGLVRQGKSQEDVGKVLTDEYKWAPRSVYAMEPALADDRTEVGSVVRRRTPGGS